MKKVIFYAILLFVVYNGVFSEENIYYKKLEFAQFDSWVRTIKIPGFKFSESEVEGSEEVYNIEYKAIFINEKNEFLQVRIGHPDIFYQYKDLKEFKIIGPYQLNSFPAVFMYPDVITKPHNAAYLLVKMPALDATFSITSSTKNRLTQEQMDEIFKYFYLNKIENNEQISWSKSIPLEIRLPSSISKFDELKNDDPQIKEVYSVKVLKSDDFILDLKKFYKERRGWLDLLTYKDIIMVCKTTNDMSILEKMQNGTEIEFIYYIK